MTTVLNLTAASTDLPISLDEAKEQLRIIDDDSRDAEIARKMRAAARWCERQIGGHRKFVKATYTLKLPCFPSDKIEFPMPPLVSVSKVNYFGSSNSSSTWSSTAYHTIIPDEQPGWIEPKVNETFPDTYDRPDAVKVTFTCGYGVPRKVPETAKEAILTMTESALDPARLPIEEAKEIASVWLSGEEYGHYA